MHGLPRTYLPVALLTLLGPLPVMLLAGDQIHPSAGGLAVFVFLLCGLARRSTLAWVLLLLWHVAAAVAVALLLGWPVSLDGLLALLISAVCAGLLLSPSMRRYVATRPGPHARPA